LDHFVCRLRNHALKNIHLAGKYHLAAGLIRGREIHNLSTNYSHFHHAEAATLRKPCILREEQKGFKAQAS